jgi:SAM-dependent methyltransferase
MTSEKDNKINNFLQYVSTCVGEGSVWKLTLSKSIRDKSLKKAVFQLVSVKDKPIVKLVESYTTKDITHSLNADQFLSLAEGMIRSDFYYADLTNENKQISLKQNKKGNITIISREMHNSIIRSPQTHDRQKHRMIPEDTHFLQVLGLSSSQGKVYAPAQKKYRQINKFVEIIDSLIKDFKTDKTITIADMGCGKAYLTFAIQYSLEYRQIPHQITGYDIRPELIKTNSENTGKLKINSLCFKQGDINELEIDDVDILIALHACDIATDMAIAKGIQAGAHYIVLSPCCHKQIRNEIQTKNPITKYGILKERQAEIITDIIRALILEHFGYKTNIFEFISSEHTGKNLMITAVKSTPNQNALREIENLKKEYGISFHYLEKLLSLQ